MRLRLGEIYSATSVYRRSVPHHGSDGGGCEIFDLDGLGGPERALAKERFSLLADDAERS